MPIESPAVKIDVNLTPCLEGNKYGVCEEEIPCAWSLPVAAILKLYSFSSKSFERICIFAVFEPLEVVLNVTSNA